MRDRPAPRGVQGPVALQGGLHVHGDGVGLHAAAVYLAGDEPVGTPQLLPEEGVRQGREQGHVHLRGEGVDDRGIPHPMAEAVAGEEEGDPGEAVQAGWLRISGREKWTFSSRMT
jgi:hypothetical protein